MRLDIRVLTFSSNGTNFYVSVGCFILIVTAFVYSVQWDILSFSCLIMAHTISYSSKAKSGRFGLVWVGWVVMRLCPVI